MGASKNFVISTTLTAEGGIVQQWALHSMAHMKWVLEHVPNSNGYVRMLCYNSGLYLGIDSSNTSLVKQYSTENDYTLWKIERSTAGNLIFKCKATESSGVAMSVPLNNGANGADLVNIAYTSDTNYRDEWKIDYICHNMILIYRTRNRERQGFADSSDNYDITPITAEDLTYGNKNETTLLTNGTLISNDDLYDNGDTWSIEKRVTLIKNFFNSQISYDETFMIILSEMIDHFVEGSGNDYSNTELTNAVKNHTNTQVYVNAVTELIKSKISQYNGNIYLLRYDEELWVNPIQRNDHVIVKAMKPTNGQGVLPNFALPYYGFNNGVPGLTLAIDGWYGNKIEIVSFEKNGSSYYGTVRFTFYDHFGLDTADLSEEKYGDLVAGTMPGFRQWYILQHWDALGVYNHPKPFVTIVSYDVEISGQY